MSTVIPKQPKKQRDQITIRLDRDVLQDLEHYCRYLESARDYIINQCLAFIFRKDKAFQLWLAAQRDGERHSRRRWRQVYERQGEKWSRSGALVHLRVRSQHAASDR